MACLINGGSAFDCADVKPGGIDLFVMLYNLIDWKNAAITLDGTDKFITNIVNATGKQAYEFSVADETGIIPTASLRAIEGNLDQYDHQLVFSVHQNDQATRNNIDKLRAAPVVAVILKNDGKGAVYGNAQGMLLTEIADNPQDPNTGSVVIVTVATKGSRAAEPYLPVLVDAGTAAATRSLIEGLTTPGV